MFVRSGDGYAEIQLMGTHEWVESGDYAGKELISRGRRNGAVCEVGCRERSGPFEAFMGEIAGHPIDFDPDALTLTYVSGRCEEMHLDGQGARRVNGEDVDLDYALYDCPYLHSDWDSGVQMARVGERSKAYRFL